MLLLDLARRSRWFFTPASILDLRNLILNLDDKFFWLCELVLWLAFLVLVVAVAELGFQVIFEGNGRAGGTWIWVGNDFTSQVYYIDHAYLMSSCSSILESGDRHDSSPRDCWLSSIGSAAMYSRYAAGWHFLFSLSSRGTMKCCSAERFLLKWRSLASSRSVWQRRMSRRLSSALSSLSVVVSCSSGLSLGSGLRMEGGDTCVYTPTTYDALVCGTL